MSNAGQSTANQILSAASQLTAAQFETYQRLCKRLLHGPQFQLIVLDCRDERLQQQLQQLLTELCQQADLPASELVLDESIPDVFALQQQLQALTSQYGVVQLTGAAQWFSQPKRWDSFNLLRENIASRSPGRLLLWLNAESIAAMIEQAPDWWAWRSGVYEFVTQNKSPATKPELQLGNLSNRHQHKDKTARRIATLSEWLKSTDAADEELAAPLWFELATLYQQQGEWDIALNLYQNECLPRFHLLKHERSEAMTYGQIAEIYMLRGDFDQSLHIRQQLELPVYQKLELARDVATTQGKIADVLYRSGDLDTATEIWKNKVLPVLKSLGDVREVAIFNSKIADVLLARELTDEALALLQDVVETLQKTDDIRSIAINQGKIAEILLQRGEFEAALRIVTEQELPVYQKLDDSHSACIAMASIADILAAQGKFDAALNLLQQEVLPVLSRIGDMYSLAAIQSKIADILFASGDATQALEIYQTVVLPLQLKLKHRPNIAHTQQQIAAIEQILTQSAALPK